MKKVAIIADNLIGATDCGVHFRKFGLKTRVVLNYTYLDSYCGEDDVLAVSTETRKLSSQEAYVRAYKAASELHSMGFRLFYKKIDSTLRGQIAEEIRAVMDALVVPLALIVPSYPAARRIVKDGYMQIVQNADAGAAFPVCFVPAIIRGGTSDVVGLLRESDVRSGEKSLGRKIAALYRGGVQMIVLDAVEEEDLRIIASVVAKIEVPCLAAGSSGLAAHLPVAWNLVGERMAAGSSIMVIVGTSNRVSADQVRTFSRAESTVLITLDSEEIYSGRWESEMEKALIVAVDALATGHVPVFAIDSLLKDCDYSMSLSERIQTYGPVIADMFAGITRSVASEGLVNTIVIVGGGTTTDVCQRLETSTIELDRELEFGIPIGTLIGGECAGLRIVTKGGGIGRIDTLTKIVDLLRSS